MWRTIYLMKLPRLEKRLRVALDWTWDLVFSKDPVKFLSRRRETISQPQEEVRGAVMRAAG
jgi:NADH dehydrogenase